MVGFPLDAVHFPVEHLALVIDLIPHLLDLVGKNVQFPVMNVSVRLFLPLVFEEVSRNVRVEPPVMGALL